MRVIALCLLLATTLSCQADETGGPAAALISVAGQGSVAAAPDMASITVGVASQAEDARSAVAANNAAMAALNKTLDGFDIEARDRQSRGFNVQPRYDNRRNTNGMPEIAGYSVSNQVTIRVRDLDRLGDLLGAVVDSGGNTINSLSFGNSNADALLDEARKLAVENARHKAELYADAAGGKLGRTVSIAEAGASVPRPELYQGSVRMMAASDMSVPISSGENEIRATVNAVYEFVE